MDAFYQKVVNKKESGNNPNALYKGGDSRTWPSTPGPEGNYGFPQWTGAEGPAGISHAADEGQWQPKTWHDTVIRWMKDNPGQGIPDFRNPDDRRKLQQYKDTHIYGTDKNGRTLQEAVETGQVDFSRLAHEYTSLASAADHQSTMDQIKQVQEAAGQRADNLNAQARAIMEQIGKQGQSFEEGMKRVREAQDKAQQAQDEVMQAIKSPPQNPQLDTISKLGSLGVVVGILGGLLTRSPMRASINAGAAALEAYNSGDQRNYKIAYDNWKTQTDMLFKIAEMQRQSVHDVLVDEEISDTERNRQLDLTLRAAGLSDLADQARIHGSEFVADWDAKMLSAQDAREQRMAAIENTNQWKMITLQTNNQKFVQSGWVLKQDPNRLDQDGKPTLYWENPRLGPGAAAMNYDGTQPYTPAGSQKIGTATTQKYGPPTMVAVKGQTQPVEAVADPNGLGWVSADAEHRHLDVTGVIPKSGAQQPLSDREIDRLANAIIRYDAPPYTSSRGGTSGQKIMSRVYELDPNYDATRYSAKQRASWTFSSGQQGNQARKFSVAIDHMDTMFDAAMALHNGDVRVLNALNQYVAREFGHEEPVDFEFVKSIALAEVASAIIGTTALADRTDLRDKLDKASSPEAVAGVMREAKKLLGGQLRNMRTQAVAAGFSPQQFDAMLSPRAKREIEGANTAHISSKEEYDALPAGTPFIWAPTGKPGTKKGAAAPTP